MTSKSESSLIDQPVVLEVGIVFKNDLLLKDYSGKLVKTLLMSGNPELSSLFQKSSSPKPKRVSISPLYVVEEGKMRAIYAGSVVGAKHIGLPTGVKPVKIMSNTLYNFYICFPISKLSDFTLALSHLDKFRFGNYEIKVSHLQYNFNILDLENEFAKVEVGLTEGRALKVVFMSPTKLKNPLTSLWARKKKLGFAFPTPSSVFSVPLYMTLLDLGLLRQSIYLRMLRYLETVMDIPYTALKTVKLVTYIYNNKSLPALIGYIKYFIDLESMKKSETILTSKIGVSPLKVLTRLLTIAKIYGVGDGRAAGFGRINIEIIP